ncbi:hypothetical protein BW731_11955 [Vagococcus martis]|uniref:DUF1440 domain-containing protein n=1 Tax=Vagococcus martis TaxID=1768210 RepID=A0A1V4DKH0_9ENTE|nr:DUF1440 domain-containing protein [Vagococcus martis]OPF88836.1 hypothetical protein BW731_11955 [Vagococcus martis]
MFELNKPRASFKEIFVKSIWFGIISGMISGMVSGMVKIGWEAILPPRTIARNLTNPPQQVMELFGVPESLTHAYVLYSEDQKVFWFSLCLHFSFSIVFSALFIFVAQYWKKIALWQGAAYGIIVWIVFHILLIPAIGGMPAPWNQPFDEHFSEFFGHIVWAWSIAACTYYLIGKDKKGNLENI